MDFPPLPAILDTLMSGVVLTTAPPHNHIIYVNKAFERMTGYAAAEMLGRTPRFLQGEDRQQPALTALSDSLRQGQEIRTVVRNYRKDGTLFWNELFLSPIRDTTGTITHYIGIQNDVTERVISRQELFFAQLSVENVPEAIFVVNAQAQIIQANQIACERLGYSLDELLSRRIYDLNPHYISENWDHHWQKIRQNKRLVLESVQESKSGQLLPVELSLNHFIFDDQEYCCYFVRDLTRRKQAETALRASQALLQAIIENLPFDLWVKDRDHRYILQNKPSIERWGDLLGQVAQDSHLDPAILAVWQEEDRRALSGEVVRAEVTYQQANEPHYYQKIVAPLHIDNKIIGIVGVNVEITEQVLAQKALQASEERLNALVNNMPVMVDAYDAEGHVVLWNKECERVTGYSQSEILANPHAMYLLYPDDAYRKSMMTAWQKIGNDYRNWEWDIACKDGQHKTISWSNISQHVAIPGYATWGIGVDVTQRQQAEQALRASEERYRVISELISDFAYSYRYEETNVTVLEWITDAFTRVTGYHANEVRNCKDWRRLVHPDDRNKLIEAQRALAAGESGMWEHRFLAQDGRLIWLRFYGHAIWDEQLGRVSRIYGAAQDITPVKLLQERLLQAQKMEAIGRLAGGVAHDFNNLLTVILSYGDLLMRRSLQDKVDWSAVGRWGQQIKQSAERAAALTHQLLAFSRQQILEPRIINLNQIISQMNDILPPLIGETVQVHTFLDSGLGQVRADPNQVEQVVLNLIVNARDAMPQGGTLTLETKNVILDAAYSQRHVDVTPGHYILLAISDTGIGIDTQTLDRIFEPFFTTKAKGKGTGLGLATVHGIVNQSGGHIWVHSKPGRGTIFKVYLPRVDVDEELPAEVTVAEFSSPGYETILLVEDEPMVRMLALDVLNLYGYHVIEATDETAEQRFAEYGGAIDLLLTDVVMPVYSGRELAEKLLLLRPQLKVLYMSGYTDNIIAHHGVLKPGTAFLQKPFTPDGLVQKVRAVLDAGGNY